MFDILLQYDIFVLVLVSKKVGVWKYLQLLTFYQVLADLNISSPFFFLSPACSLH